MSERMHDWIAKAVSEQMTSLFADSISQLASRVAALEDKLNQTDQTENPSENASALPRSTTLPKPTTLPKQAKSVEPKSVTSTVHSKNVDDQNKPTLISVVDTPSLNDSNTRKNNEEWVEVARRRPRSPPQGLLRGTAAPGTTELQASERQRHFHLFYLKIGTTEEQVRNHLKKVTQCDACKVESLKARGPYASFKLSVPFKVSESVLAPDSWPEDVCIKPWRRPFRPDEKREDAS